MTLRRWPEAVERVTVFLREAGAEARVEEFPAGTPTAAAAAHAIGCDLNQIVKSLVFECDARPVLAMVPGDRKADPGKVAAGVGAASARIASANRVQALTGFEPGAVCPFPLPQIERTLLDRRLLTVEEVWVGAGSTRHLVALAPAELMRLARATPVDIASDD